MLFGFCYSKGFKHFASVRNKYTVCYYETDQLDESERLDSQQVLYEPTTSVLSRQYYDH